MESVALCAVLAVAGVGAWSQWGRAASDAIAGHGAVGHVAVNGDGSTSSGTRASADGSPSRRGRGGAFAVSAQAGSWGFFDDLTNAAKALPKAGTAEYRGYAESIGNAFHGGDGFALLPTEHIFTERVGDSLLFAGQGMRVYWQSAKRAHFSVGYSAASPLSIRHARRGEFADEAHSFLRTYHGWLNGLLHDSLGNPFDVMQARSPLERRNPIVQLAYEGPTRSTGWRADAGMINAHVTPKGPGDLYVPRALAEVEQWTAHTKPTQAKFFDEAQSAFLESQAVAVPRGQIFINAGMYGRGQFRNGQYLGPVPTARRAPTFQDERVRILHPDGM